jgi:adenine phosphoribosyltransferase
MEHSKKIEYRNSIRDALPIYKDWPKEGINYLNTVDLCSNPKAFRDSVEFYYEVACERDVDYVFVAYRLGVPLHGVRKKGKMPGDLVSREYVLEYGTDILELQRFKYKAGGVLIVDDVLATGGTAEAICKLVHECGVPFGNMTVACLLDITFLPGKVKLRNLGVNVETLIDVNE